MIHRTVGRVMLKFGTFGRATVPGPEWSRADTVPECAVGNPAPTPTTSPCAANCWHGSRRDRTGFRSLFRRLGRRRDRNPGYSTPWEPKRCWRPARQMRCTQKILRKRTTCWENHRLHLPNHDRQKTGRSAPLTKFTRLSTYPKQNNHHSNRQIGGRKVQLPAAGVQRLRPLRWEKRFCTG